MYVGGAAIDRSHWRAWCRHLHLPVEVRNHAYSIMGCPKLHNAMIRMGTAKWSQKLPLSSRLMAPPKPLSLISREKLRGS
eukprot:3591612-Amphidinium_carterae.1